MIGLDTAIEHLLSLTHCGLLFEDSNPESGELFKVNSAALFGKKELLGVRYCGLLFDKTWLLTCLCFPFVLQVSWINWIQMACSSSTWVCGCSHSGKRCTLSVSAEASTRDLCGPCSGHCIATRSWSFGGSCRGMGQNRTKPTKKLTCQLTEWVTYGWCLINLIIGSYPHTIWAILKSWKTSLFCSCFTLLIVLAKAVLQEVTCLWCCSGDVLHPVFASQLQVLILDPPRRGLACRSWRSGLPAGQEEVEQIRQSFLADLKSHSTIYQTCRGSFLPRDWRFKIL